MHLDARTSRRRACTTGCPASIKRAGILDANLMIGYVWADEPRATACAVVTGLDKAAASKAAEEIALSYWNAREEFGFGPVTGPLEDMLDIAETSRTAPVILADSADNPTGGGVGDRADVLNALIARNFEGALMAGITDRPAVEACFAAGKGAKLSLKIGGSLDPASTPAKVDAEVTCLDDQGRRLNARRWSHGWHHHRACRTPPSLSQYRGFHPPGS
jgi:microcystin degradation protein MlrC